VREPYGDIVYLGDTPEAFVAACERALASSQEERAQRAEKMHAVLKHTSWDATVAAMQRLIEVVRQRRPASVSAAVDDRLWHVPGCNRLE
jgi:UDP-galactopyranose mutase